MDDGLWDIQLGENGNAVDTVSILLVMDDGLWEVYKIPVSNKAPGLNPSCNG